ncbi:MAG TPA: SpoIIE family protein phosphatase [Solirubrobacteraceae bacterium]|nr:SpoIIE family protein phosphatase [Solirubrobacteraceae bacterium]
MAADRPSVLLVDDRRENLLALEAVLQPLGCRMVSVTSGEEALRQLLLEDFALILLDVQMPVLDGFETAEYIKRRERTRDIPILFVTAISKDRGHVFRGYEAGAVDYVFKPYDPEVLRAKVAVFLRLHSTSRALARSEAVLRAAFDSAPIGKARLDADGRILEANPALGRTLGRDSADLQGRTLRSLVHAEDADADAADRAALLGGLRGPYDAELRLVAPDGTEIPCLCSFSGTHVPNEPDALVVQVQDLRERRRAEAERETLVREQAARAEAERVAGRLDAVGRLADAALGSASVRDIVQELLLNVGDVLPADGAAIVLLGDAGEPTVHRVDGSVRATLRSAPWTPAEEGPAARALAGTTVVVDDASREPAGSHPLAERVRGLLAVPLRAEGEVVGALFVGSLFPRTFGVEDVSVLTLVADRIGLAIQRMRLYEQQRAIATRLQRSLLPQELPRVPGIWTAARYGPGGAGTEVGGDWYDAIGMADGRLLLVMGDVAGRGIEAASMMGQLRSAIRAYALQGEGPAALLERLNAFLLQLAEDTMATVLLACVDHQAGAVTLASAGHPPALLVGPGGASRWLTGGRGVPIGALDEPGYEQAEEPLAPGSTLVLYTDGLVEQRGEDLRTGLDRLAASVLDGPPDLEALCDHVLRRADREPGSDDVSLLVLRTIGAADDRVVLEMPGDAAALVALRAALRRWLAASHADAEEIDDITMAANEAVQNAIEHGHARNPRPFEVELSRRAGEVAVTVRDHGSWRSGSDADRGRGIPLMRALMTDVHIERGGAGTTVTLRRRLRADVPAASAPARP